MTSSETRFAIVGLGEVLWDCFDEERHPGGAPANVAFQSHQLGERGVICSRVGPDELGAEFLEFITAKGLETTFIQQDAARPTGRATVEEDAAGHPKFIIHEHVAWDALAWTDAAQDLMQSADAVCFGTLGQRSETSRKTIYQCLDAAKPDCRRVYDVNLRQRWYERTWVEASLARANVVKLNEDEVPVIAKLLELPALPTDETSRYAAFARELRKFGPIELVCVTRGAAGCVLLTEQETIAVPGEPIRVADTVGAGDAFTAGMIVGTLSGWPLEAVAAFANSVGGLVASRPGAMPELTKELAALKNRYAGKSQ